MNWDKRDIINICKIVAFGIILFWILNNLTLFGTAITTLCRILSPFIIGAAIAFIINIPMTIFENKVFVKRKQTKNNKKKDETQKISKTKRLLCILLSFLIIILVLIGVLRLVIPEIISAISAMVAYIPELFNNIQSWAIQKMTDYPEIREGLENILLNLESFSSNVIEYLTDIGTNLLTSSFGIISSTISGIARTIIAIIFSIYVLLDKEKIFIQLKKFTYAFCSKNVADNICKIATMSKNAFNNFITGQFTECIILGCLCAIGMLILRLPYSATVGVLVAITAIIPIVGAFIGGFIGVILLLPVSFAKAIIFLIFFIILQQMENNLIYPKVVGESVGVPRILVLIAITVGGALWGAIGMIIALPLTSVLYTLVREITNKRLKQKYPDQEEET